MTATDRLLPWLTAQLDADEQWAKAADPGPWGVGEIRGMFDESGNPATGNALTVIDGKVWPQPGVIRGSHVYSRPDVGNGRMIADLSRGYIASRHEANAEHIATHDPARVLRQVAAMRRRLERHQPRGEFCTLSDFEVDVGPWPCWEIRNDLLVFADRDGFDPRWVREEGL